MRFFDSAILIFFLFHLNENKQPVHMRYHLFLRYGWFLQNLAKDFIPTNMHTTVGHFFWPKEPNPNWLISNLLPWGLTRPKNGVHQIDFWFLDWTLISIHLRLTHTDLDPEDCTRLTHEIWLAQNLVYLELWPRKKNFIWKAFTLGSQVESFVL